MKAQQSLWALLVKHNQPGKLSFLLYLLYFFMLHVHFQRSEAIKNGWYLAYQTLENFDVNLKKDSNYAIFMHEIDADKTFECSQI